MKDTALPAFHLHPQSNLFLRVKDYSQYITNNTFYVHTTEENNCKAYTPISVTLK